MKKAIVEGSIRFTCPYCGENRSSMMMITSGDFYQGWNIDWALPGDTISCVSCKKEFER